jgi:hypothetical protein
MASFSRRCDKEDLVSSFPQILHWFQNLAKNLLFANMFSPLRIVHQEEIAPYISPIIHKK